MLWLVVCVGAMGLAFGGGLLGCTIIGQRGDLWNWGLLTALAGQLVLFLGIAGLLFLRVLKKSSLHNAPLAMADLASAPFTHPPRLPWSQRCDAALALRLDDPR